jgi:hypothetical protein
VVNRSGTRAASSGVECSGPPPTKGPEQVGATCFYPRDILDERYMEYEFPGFGKFVNEPRLAGIGAELSF